jgi:hypothetical protein
MKGEKRNTSRLLVGKLERVIPLGKPRGRWMDNIKMYPGEMIEFTWLRIWTWEVFL